MCSRRNPQDHSGLGESVWMFKTNYAFKISVLLIINEFTIKLLRIALCSEFCKKFLSRTPAVLENDFAEWHLPALLE